MSNDAALVYGTDSTGSLGNASQLVYIYFILKSGHVTKKSVGSWDAMHDSFSSSSSSQASYLDDSEGSSSRHKFSSKFNHKVSLYQYFLNQTQDTTLITYNTIRYIEKNTLKFFNAQLQLVGG